jgi:hypothetical protein
MGKYTGNLNPFTITITRLSPSFSCPCPCSQSCHPRLHHHRGFRRLLRGRSTPAPCGTAPAVGMQGQQVMIFGARRLLCYYQDFKQRNSEALLSLGVCSWYKVLSVQRQSRAPGTVTITYGKARIFQCEKCMLVSRFWFQENTTNDYDSR